MSRLGIAGTECPDFETLMDTMNDLRPGTPVLLDKMSSVRYLSGGSSSLRFSSVFDESYLDATDKSVVQTMLSEISMFDLFQCDAERFTYYGVPFPSEKKLHELADFMAGSFLSWVRQNEIDFVLYEGPTNFFTRLIQRLSEIHDIKLVSFRFGRRGDSMFVGGRDPTEMFFKNPLNLGGEYKQPSYMDKSHKNHRSLFVKLLNFTNTSLYRDIKSFKHIRLIRREEKILCYFVPFLTLIFKSRLIFIMSRLRRYFYLNRKANRFSIKHSDGTLIVVYPEHFHPEASTSSYDYEYLDDVKNIENIRRLLPSKVRVVYRFHPSMWGRDALHKYIRIFNLPGVEVSTPNQPMEDLLEIASVCISISSTTVIDFIKKGKPAVLFGHSELRNINHGLLSHCNNLVEACNTVSQVVVDSSPQDNAIITEQLLNLYTQGSFSDPTWLREIIYVIEGHSKDV
jgi:hypothetical protein